VINFTVKHLKILLWWLKKEKQYKGYASQDKTVKTHIAKFQQEESGIIIHSANYQNIYW